MPASSTVRATLKLKCEPWPTSILRPRATASRTKGCSAPSVADEAAGMAAERMRQNVARLHEIDDLREDAVRIDRLAALVRQWPQLAEMNVDRQPRAPADLGGGFDHLDAPARESAEFRVRLDSLDQIAIGFSDAHRSVDVDAVRTIERRIIVALETADQVGGEEGDHAAVRRSGHDSAEIPAGSCNSGRPDPPASSRPIARRTGRH